MAKAILGEDYQVNTSTHPDVLSQAELEQIPAEMVRLLTVYKYGGGVIPAGALAQAQTLMKRFDIRKDITPEQFIEVYILPAMQ
jgi:hypothetical protein